MPDRKNWTAADLAAMRCGLCGAPVFTDAQASDPAVLKDVREFPADEVDYWCPKCQGKLKASFDQGETIYVTVPPRKAAP